MSIFLVMMLAGAPVTMAAADRTTGAAPSACARPGDDALHPADLLDLEDGFRDALSRHDRARLDAILPRTPDGRIAQCEQRDGTACDAAAYLPALRAVGLMPRFLDSLCPGPADEGVPEKPVPRRPFGRPKLSLG